MTAAYDAVAKQSRRRKLRNNLAGYAFLMPWLFGLIAFTFVPMLYTILRLKAYHYWASFPPWRCFIPVSVALLRLPPFSLARAKNPSQI